MLYLLLYPLREVFSPFNLFQYITFRAAYAAITALFLSFILGPFLIRRLRRWKTGDQIRADLPENHHSKKGTPSMGGILIVLSILLSTLLWADISDSYILLILFSTLWLGSTGFLDDYLKMKRGRGMGMKWKLMAQALLGIGIGISLLAFPLKEGFATKTHFLFLKNVYINLGWFYIPYVALVIVGTSNAVNLADGLDGLAIGLVGVAGLAFAILSYVAGHAKLSEYLNLLFLPGSGELTVFALSLVGAALGFLWFNSHPAEIFMGDTGSLALGGALGTIAVLIKQEILLLIIGGVFVIEALSVILQVSYFKLAGGRRLFQMAPLHHHFELKGWGESKIVVRFWILAILFGLIGLSTLKIR
ncbi:phospho-N-acetylmuramoyl-pentapeptide-transferase [candidate division TA06 bacterium]|nr:phospho-N-acetylmuramoyl-pentapeptide-transferase [candidate division TA06 bacterium]